MRLSVDVADIAGFANRRAGCVPRGRARPTRGWTMRAEPPYCPNPGTQPAPFSSTRPAHHQVQHPSSTLSSVVHTHTHTLFSLSCCVPVPLSPSTSSKWSELLSSLLSSLHPSTTLFLPPPAVRATRTLAQAVRLHLHKLNGSQACYFPKLLLKT